MFGFGRRKDEDFRRRQAREGELSQQLEQTQCALLEAEKRAEQAESQAAFLASQNRALAAKVHRLALQRVELQNNHDQLAREHKELQVTNLQLEGEAQAAKAAKADAWQVPNLKAALRQQAAQHEKKMESLKHRTQALLTAMLPGGHNKTAGQRLLPPGESSSPGSPESVSAEQDLWSAPLTPPPMVEYNQPDVHLRIRQIIGCLYDDTLTEDQALEQMTALTKDIVQSQSPEGSLLDRGCSPFPVPKLATGDAASEATEMVDAATDMRTHRASFLAHASTETPAEMSYVGTPRDAPASPSRLTGGKVVPTLDLAALVAQAMEDVPLSARSNASTSASGTGGASFNAFSQFVLAQPEKLQRLIMRHAAATGATTSGSRPPQSPYTAAGLLPTAAAASTTLAAPADLHLGSGASMSMDPTSLATTSLPGNPRPSFTSRLLGLGGAATSSNRANARAAVHAPELAASSGNSNATPAGVLMPSSAANTTPPAPGGKRAGTSSVAPKFVTLDGPGSMSAAPRGSEGPAKVLLPGAKLISGLESSSSTSYDGPSANVGNGLGAGVLGKGKMDMLENDFLDLKIGTSSVLSAFRR